MASTPEVGGPFESGVLTMDIRTWFSKHWSLLLRVLSLIAIIVCVVRAPLLILVPIVWLALNPLITLVICVAVGALVTTTMDDR